MQYKYKEIPYCLLSLSQEINKKKTIVIIPYKVTQEYNCET